jgi:hypothetical protein
VLVPANSAHLSIQHSPALPQSSLRRLVIWT